MSKEIKKDILGQIPSMGDTIIFNPPGYKGLVYGICQGFSKYSGLPEVHITSTNKFFGKRNKEGHYTPKTGFVTKHKYQEND